MPTPPPHHHHHQGYKQGKLALPFISHIVVHGQERDTFLSLTPHHPQQVGLSLGSREQESWPCFTPAAALGRTGPAPQLGSTGKLALVIGLQPRGCEHGRTGPTTVCHQSAWKRERCPPLSLPLATYSRLESWTWGHETKRAVPIPHLLQCLGELAQHLAWTKQ